MLTHGRIEKVVAERVAGRHADAKGLMLVVGATGSASWILRVQHAGRRRDVGLGGYPDVGLSDARHAADDMRRAVREGRDVVAERRRPSMPTFREAALGALACRGAGFRAKRTSRDWWASMENHAGQLLPRDVSGITSADVLRVLAPLWGRSPALARSLRQRIRQSFRWAQAYGHIEHNPAGEGIDAALPSMPKAVTHLQALPYEQVGAALLAVNATTASESVKLALRFVTLTATRSSETTGARWQEVDLEAHTWTVPASRMKAGREHRVPLSRAAMDVLKQARGLGDGSGLVFPSPYKRGGRLDGHSLRNALKAAGVDSTVHGLRTAFRSWCAETGQRWDACEMALAHAVGNAVERSYQRSDLLEARRAIMERWGAYLEGAHVAS